MGEFLNNTQTEPSTPPTDTAFLYPDSTSELWTGKDDAGRVYPYIGTWGTFLASNFTGQDVNTAQPIFSASQDTFTLPANTAFIMDACFHIHTTGTTSHALSLLFGGTATLTSIGGSYFANNVATEGLGAISAISFSAATAVAVSPATATATHHSIMVRGIVRVNAAGTFIPQYQWSASPGAAGVTLANSYFVLHPLGPGARTLIGSVA
jgi:uncharacterized protein (UPF0333 family)